MKISNKSQVINEPWHEISNNVVCVTSKDQSHAQSDLSLCLSFEYSMTVKILTEQNLEFLSLTGSSEYTLTKTHIVGNHMSQVIIHPACKPRNYHKIVLM